MSASANEVLLVEDDRDVREAIAEVLEEEGYQVAVARTGADAVRHLKGCHELPTAIVLDLMMPVMDGWEFWALKQTNPQWAGVPVVIVSADTNVAEKARSLRAAATLRKPIDIDQLLGILKALAGRACPPSSV